MRVQGKRVIGAVTRFDKTLRVPAGVIRKARWCKVSAIGGRFDP